MQFINDAAKVIIFLQTYVITLQNYEKDGGGMPPAINNP